MPESLWNNQSGGIVIFSLILSGYIAYQNVTVSSLISAIYSNYLNWLKLGGLGRFYLNRHISHVIIVMLEDFNADT